MNSDEKPEYCLRRSQYIDEMEVWLNKQHLDGYQLATFRCHNGEFVAVMVKTAEGKKR